MDSTERLDQIDRRLEQLGTEITEFRERLAEQTANILTLQTLGAQLLEIVRTQQQQTTIDREEFRREIRQMQQRAETDREEFRQEIRQIWQYLLSQRSNGNEG